MGIFGYIILGLILVIVIALLVLLEKYKPSDNIKAFVEKSVADIDKRTDTEDIHSLKAAIIDYDSLLDHVMKDKRIPGSSMGERLKSAGRHFQKPIYNNIWEAHKMRNRLVHEPSFTSSKSVLQSARITLKTAIQSLL